MSKDVKDFGEYSVKGIKSFMGMEGLGFNCSLYRGKKKVAFCIDDATGGMININWAEGGWKGEEAKLLEAHIDKLDPVEHDMGGAPLKIDDGWFITELVSKWEDDAADRKIERACKTKTLFRTSGQTENQYWILKAPFDDMMKAHLELKYGDALVEIINEKFLQPA